MTHSWRAGGGGAQRTRCPRCNQPVLRQLVGQRAALNVVADAEPIPPAAAHALREPDRLDWCLRTTGGGHELRWADCHRRTAECPYSHVIDHQCTAPLPARQQRRTRQTAVPDGQLTL